MKPFRTLLLVFALFQAANLRASESEPWLQLTKSDAGFLFEGVEIGGRFSFEVPGTTIKTAKDGDKAFATIDDVVVQVFRTDPPGNRGKASLAKYRENESRYVEAAGGKVGASALCESVAAEHQEWRGELPNGATSLFFATLVGAKLLVVVVAADSALAQLASVKLSAICSSFKA